MTQENTKTKTDNTEPKATDTTVESNETSSKFLGRLVKLFHDKEDHSFVNGE